MNMRRFSEAKTYYNYEHGDIPKRLKGVVLKTTRAGDRRVGSNPTISASRVKNKLSADPVISE